MYYRRPVRTESRPKRLLFGGREGRLGHDLDVADRDSELCFSLFHWRLTASRRFKWCWHGACSCCYTTG